MLVSALTLSFSIAHATDWLEKGGVGKQDPSEPSLQMPLSFEAGYTQFLDDCEDADTKIVTPVSCGVYGISTNGTVYTLRYIDGGTIGGKNAWKVADFTRIPRMEKEGLIMYKNDNTQQLYLITPTGAVEALPKKYVNATNFVDGIAAVATATSGYALTWTFIDRSLKPFAPGVVTQPMQFGKNQFTNAPLRGSMRAVYVPNESGYDGSWGFMNGLGKIVIKPQYREVRSFSDSMALVIEKSDDFYFIDVTGRKCFEPRKVDEDIFPSSVSDYDGGLCTIAPMEIGDNFYARYYTTSGKLSGVALWGSALHNGKGYMRFIDKAEDEEFPSVLIIQPSVDGYDSTKGMRIDADPHTQQCGAHRGTTRQMWHTSPRPRPRKWAWARTTAFHGRLVLSAPMATLQPLSFRPTAMSPSRASSTAKANSASSIKCIDLEIRNISFISGSCAFYLST